MERHAVTKERAIPRPVDCTLGMIDTKLQLRLKIPGDARQDAMATDSATDVNVAIVGVTAEAVSASLQLFVEIIQEDVRQQWTQRTALRRALGSLRCDPGGHHACTQISAYQLEDPLVSDLTGHP